MSPQKLFEAQLFSSVQGEYADQHTHFSILFLNKQDDFKSGTHLNTVF